MTQFICSINPHMIWAISYGHRAISDIEEEENKLQPVTLLFDNVVFQPSKI